MKTAASKSIGQIVILVVLVVALGFSTMYMWRAFNPPSKPAQTQTPMQSSPAAQAQAPATAPAGGAPGTAAPPAGGAAAQPKAAPGSFPMLASGEVNADLFRVYSLQPPKNPFMPKEEWFKDELEQIPGYPELRDNRYFESMSPEFPDIAQTFGADRKWKEIMLKREEAADVKLDGMSKDGRISTTIELTEDVPEGFNLTWTADSGIPLSALEDPNFVRANADKLTGQPGTARPDDGGALMVPGTTEDTAGLNIPGETSDTGETTTTGLITGEAKGDTLACVGVNFKGGKATALMHYNGVPYLVSEGSVLPTHYQVVEIKEDGVVLLELRDGSSKWIPLSQASVSRPKKNAFSTPSSSPTQQPRTDNVAYSLDGDFERQKRKDSSLANSFQYDVTIDCSGNPNSGLWWYDLYLYEHSGAVIGHVQGEVDFSMGRSQTVRQLVRTTERVADYKVIWGQGTTRVRPD